MHFADRMAAAVRKTGSITCVGLDPRKAQLPAPIRDVVRHDTDAEWAEAYGGSAAKSSMSSPESSPVSNHKLPSSKHLGPPA